MYEDNSDLAMGFFMNYEEDQIARNREKMTTHGLRLEQMRKAVKDKEANDA